jgi:hypothetical protein
MSVVMKKSPISSDISNSSAELPFQPKLSSYPTNKQNSGFGAWRLVRLEPHLVFSPGGSASLIFGLNITFCY